MPSVADGAEFVEVASANNSKVVDDGFLTVKKLFDLENPRHSPIFTEFRTQVKKKAWYL